MIILADRYRLLTVQAIFSNDTLMEALTLKGGNAMQLLEITDRASQDLDFSIKQGIKLSEEVEGKMFKNSLERIFEENNLVVIDYKFTNKPKKSKSLLPPFWGGYAIEFKVVKTEIYNQYKDTPQRLSTMSEAIDGDKKRIEIDISLEEYTEPRIAMDLNEYTIYLYSPLMIVYEKIRALCQQLPSYPLASTEKVRARDLYDIYIAIMKSPAQELKDEILNPENIYILEEMFKTKNVDIELLKGIEGYHDELLQDYNDRVLAQISANAEKPEFEFLFSYNLEIIYKLYQLLNLR